jgi:hypothetical protein
MTRDDIIKQMGWPSNANAAISDLVDRVEAVVRKAEKAEREACAKACEDYSADRWAAYKGQPPYEPMNSYRGNPHAQGQSSGAEDCADAIRARGESK